MSDRSWNSLLSCSFVSGKYSRWAAAGCRFVAGFPAFPVVAYQDRGTDVSDLLVEPTYATWSSWDGRTQRWSPCWTW